ncbi:MAG: dUTP diphosphatase [Proteobacteria bacterium]|nr:dUTP diphosphatase [Pseudomonadota bacterium]
MMERKVSKKKAAKKKAVKVEPKPEAKKKAAPCVEVVLKHGVELPQRHSAGAAWYDLCAMVGGKQTIANGGSMNVSTGISLKIPEGMAGLIVPRSGLGASGLVLGNLVGVIDSDYRGEVMVNLWNRSREVKFIEPGMRIAQLLFVRVEAPVLESVESLEDSPRGDGGFGSTGE